MAMLFHDEKYMTCPKCGAKTMVVDKVYRFSKDPKDPAAINGEYLYNVIRCSECGAILDSYRQEQIRVNQ